MSYTDHVAHWPWRQERVGAETALVVCGCDAVLYHGEVPDDEAEAATIARALDSLAEAATTWASSHPESGRS